MSEHRRLRSPGSQNTEFRRWPPNSNTTQGRSGYLAHPVEFTVPKQILSMSSKKRAEDYEEEEEEENEEEGGKDSRLL